MRRVNVHLDDQLDARLSREASRTGESRAALLRQAAREFLDQRTRAADGGWAAFTGAVAETAPRAAHHDDDDIYR
jgi:predicted transcriptional regulator